MYFASLLSNMWRRMPRGFLALVMLLTGAAGLIYEYVLSTVFSYMLGSSIEQFSVTIGVMLVMMGVSGLVQTRLRGPLPLYFVTVELLLVLLGGFAPIALQWAFANMQADFSWIKIAYPGLIGLLIGIEIPLAMCINEKSSSSLKNNIAGTWAWDYIGSALGVIVWLWLLRKFVPITHISFWVAGVNLLVAIMALGFFWRRGLIGGRPSKILAPLLTIGTIFLMLVGFTRVDSWNNITTQKLYDNPIVLHTTTKYQDIVITEGVHPTNPQAKSYELFLNGNKQFGPDEKIYHEHLVHPAMNLAARHSRVLVLGGGDGLAVRELLKYDDVQSITLVDLDPEMIRLASTNPILTMLNNNAFADARVHSRISDGVTDTDKHEDVNIDTGQAKAKCDKTGTCYSQPVTEKVASVTVYTIDADRFVATPQQPYDVVIVDLPDPNSVELAKLYSLEFYQKVRHVTAPDGIVVVQATSPYHAKEAFLCIMRTMATAGLNVLPYHTNVPSFGDWGWVMGSPTLDPRELRDRAKNLKEYGVSTSELGPDSMSAALVFNKGWLSTDNTKVSMLMNPVIFGLYTYEAWKTD